MKRATLTAAVCLSFACDLAAQPLAPNESPSRAAALPADACAGGWIRDDGSAETGYGWVPSSVEGIYVQEVKLTELGSRNLASVCVCWLRTRTDNDVDFDVVFYGDAGGRPQLQPLASVPARAEGVPMGVTGRFYEVDVSGIKLPGQTSYVGVRWNPNADDFFFVCVDQNPLTERIPTFFIDDRASGWGDALNTIDPIFDGHRAMLMRLNGGATPDIPGLAGPGLLIFGLGLAAAGLRAMSCVKALQPRSSPGRACARSPDTHHG